MIAGALAPKIDSQAGNKEEIRSATAPRAIVYGRARMAGAMVYAGTHGTDNKFLSMVFVVAGHEVDAFEKWFLNDQAATLDGGGLVAAGQYAGKVRITAHLGTASQAADTALVADVGEWTTAHQLKGLAYFVVRFEFDPEVFTGGRPKVTAVIRGAKLFDPRDSTTVWSNNWALVMRDYLTRDPLGTRIPVADIDDAAVIAAANIADENVVLKAGGTQKRYTADGVVDSRRSRESVIGDMLTAGAGQLIYQSGKFTLYAGADTPAAVSLDEGDLRGPMAIRTKRSMRERVNRVRGQFLDAQADLYEANDYPVQIDAAAETADGEPLESNLDLPFVQDGIRAQRIAHIALAASRREISASFPANLKGLQLQAWSVVQITNARFGWTNKLFRVVGWQLSAEGGVDLALAEYDANIYAWNAATDEKTVPTPAAPTLDPGQTVPAVAGMTVTPITIAKGGAKIPGLQAAWTAPSLTVGNTEVQVKKNADANWDPGPPVLDPQNPRALITGMLPGESYDVRVRHKSRLAKFGAWATVNATAAAADSFIAGDVLAGAGKAVKTVGAEPNPADLAALDPAQDSKLSGIAAGATATTPGNLVHNGNARLGDNTNFSALTYEAAGGVSGTGIFSSTDQAQTRFSDALIPVDAENIAYEMKAAIISDTANTTALFGLDPLDKNGVHINLINSYHKTDVNLFAAVAPTDMMVKILEPVGWDEGPFSHIMFNTAADGSDLPNFSAVKINSIQKFAGSRWELTLASQANVTQASGTLISNSVAGATFMYSLVSGGTLQTSWNPASRKQAIISGINGVNQQPGLEFRRGTKFVRVLLAPNYNSLGGKTLIDDVSLRPLAFATDVQQVGGTLASSVRDDAAKAGAGLLTGGDLARDITGARRDSSNLLGRSAGGLFTGELGADVSKTATVVYIDNPDFEGADKNVFAANSGANPLAAVNDPANAFIGSWVGKFTANGVADNVINLRNVPVVPGQRFLMSSMVKGGTAGTVQTRVFWRDAGGAQVGFSDGATLAAGSSTYQEVRNVVTAPAGTIQASFGLVFQGPPTGIWYFDARRVTLLLNDLDIDALSLTNAPAAAGADVTAPLGSVRINKSGLNTAANTYAFIHGFDALGVAADVDAKINHNGVSVTIPRNQFANGATVRAPDQQGVEGYIMWETTNPGTGVFTVKGELVNIAAANYFGTGPGWFYLGNDNSQIAFTPSATMVLIGELDQDPSNPVSPILQASLYASTRRVNGLAALGADRTLFNTSSDTLKVNTVPATTVQGDSLLGGDLTRNNATLLNSSSILGVNLGNAHYGSGVTFDSLKPAQAGAEVNPADLAALDAAANTKLGTIATNADVTGSHQAASIANQGALATKGSVALASVDVTGLLPLANADPGLRNTGVTINSSGSLGGAGGGQVTIGGLGYTGALNADKTSLNTALDTSKVSGVPALTVKDGAAKATNGLDIAGNALRNHGIDQGDTFIRSLTHGLGFGFATDGAAVTFVHNWANPPSVQFLTGGLTQTDLVTTGNQVQVLQAQNVTISGFTPLLRVRGTVGTSNPITDTGAVAGTMPQLVMNKTAADAFDDTYTFKFNVSITNLFSQDFQGWLGGNVTIGVYVKDVNNVWVQQGMIPVHGNGADGNISIINGRTASVIVAGVGTTNPVFGLHLESSQYGGSLNFFTSVSYTTTPGPPQDFTATPAGSGLNVLYAIMGGAE